MTLVIIPARQKSERLPNKPLQSIGSDPLIVHCWRRAMEADIGPVWVASDSLAIVEAVEKRGGRAIVTGEADSGTDRVALTAEVVDPQAQHAHIVKSAGRYALPKSPAFAHLCTRFGRLGRDGDHIFRAKACERDRWRGFSAANCALAYRTIRFHARSAEALQEARPFSPGRKGAA